MEFPGTGHRSRLYAHVHPKQLYAQNAHGIKQKKRRTREQPKGVNKDKEGSKGRRRGTVNTTREKKDKKERNEEKKQEEKGLK